MIEGERMKVSIRNVAISLIVIATFIVGYFFMFDKNDEEIPKEKETNIDYGKLDEVVFKVKTEKIRKGDLVITITSNGIIKANNEINVCANITGDIESIYVTDGMFVKKNQLLMKLDDKAALIDLQSAESVVKKALAELNVELNTASQSLDNLLNEDKSKFDLDIIYRKKLELKQKFSEGKISSSELNDKLTAIDIEAAKLFSNRIEVIKNRTGLTTAYLNYEKARLNYEYTKIRAPFNGFVGNINLSESGRVTAGTELMKLIDNSKLKIEVGVLENEIALIKPGNSVEIFINALANKKFAGIVKSVSPFIDNETKTCRVIVEMQNTDSRIKPGMYATVKLQSEVMKNRLLIPRSALLMRDERSLVFTAEDSLAKWKYVKIGRQNDEYYEVLRGVKEGEEVITEGNYNLAHDAKIKVLK